MFDFRSFFEWAKVVILGYIQRYIYGQYQDFLEFLKRKGWMKDDGTIVVPPDKLDDFAKDCWKAIAWVIRHGSPA